MAYPPVESPAVAEPPTRQVKRRSAAQTKKLLKTARDRFKQIQDAEKNQRQRELDDIRFYNGEQWPEDVRASRAGMQANNGLPPVPARPCITINKTREPVRAVLNQERGSDMGIEIVPADDFGELIEPIPDTEIKLREGLTRRIQRESKAQDARTWAFARAVQAGRGYYMVMTRYVDGKTNDQEVYVHRLYNQSCAGLDPAHEMPDGSDAEFEFVGTDIPWDRYKAEHGERNGKPNRFVEDDFSDEAWRQLGEDQPGWFTGSGDMRFVRVVDYLYTVRKSRQLIELTDGTLFWGDELPEGVTDDQINQERTVIQKSIKWAKIDGSDDDVLEETDWPGPDMPIVKVLGDELQPVDDERRAEGMVRPMREPGQGFNVMVSKQIEVIGLAPMPSLMVEEGTIEGYEEFYKAANTRTLPWLPFKMTTLDGRPAASPPFSVPREAPIAAISAAIAMFDDAIQSTSAVSDPAMGQTDSSVQSAKHANLLAQQAKEGTSNYMDNLQRSLRYEGQIINNLLYPIYGRKPGRVARIVNGQGEGEDLIVGQPMVQQGGRPALAQPNDPNAKKYALTKDAKFNVIVKVTKNFDSRRDQEATTVGELISANPLLMTWFGDLYFKNLDGPGHDEMADRTKVMLDPKILQMLEAKKQGQDIPPGLQAKMAQAEQEKQQLMQQLQQAVQMLQAEKVKEDAESQRNQAKLAADVEQTRIKADADLQMEAMKQRTQLTIEEFKMRGAQMQMELDAVQAERDRLAAGQQQSGKQAHEAGIAAMGQEHEGAQQAAAQGHESSEAAHQRAAAQQGQQSDQQHAAEMQAEQQRAAAEQAAIAAQQQQGGE